MTKTHITEGSILLNKELHRISNKVIESFENFLNDGIDEEFYKETGQLYGRRLNVYINDKKFAIDFFIFESSKYNSNDNDKSDGSGGYVLFKHKTSIDFVLYLKPNIENWDELKNSFFKNKKVRKKIVDKYRSNFERTIYHEVGHIVKNFVYDFSPDNQQAYDKYLKKPRPTQTRANYAKISGEYESILSEIMADIKLFVSKYKNSNPTLKDILNYNSLGFRKFIIGMIDINKILDDYNENKNLNKINRLYKIAKYGRDEDHMQMVILKDEALGSLEYIHPQFQSMYKKTLYKLIDWWKKTYPQYKIK